MQVKSSKTIRFFCFIQIIFLSFSLHAEESFFIVDRRGFKAKPDTACTSIFNNNILQYSSCNSIGFKTSPLIQSNNDSFEDYLYFFKIDSTKL